MLLFLNKIKTKFIISHSFSTTSFRSPNPNFILDFLINSLGLSPKEALKSSASISHIKSPSNPNAVIDFLKRNGFSDADIKSVVISRPMFLCARVEKTLEPRWKALQEIGFTGFQSVRLISKNPNILRSRNVYQKVELLKSLVGSNDMLFQVCMKNNSLIACSFQNVLLPNLSLLRECGIPDRQIATVLRVDSRLITYSKSTLKKLIARTEEFGVPLGSGMFVYLLCALCFNSSEAIDAKIKLFKSFGWSEEEVATAIRTSPPILRFSEDAIRARMEFLLKEVGCEASYIARYPRLLQFSMKKRLVPRLQVVKNLKQKGLFVGKTTAWCIMSVSDELFMKKFLLRFADVAPGLVETYTAACAGIGED